MTGRFAPSHLWSRWLALLAEREPGTTLALFRIACGVCILLVVGGVAVEGMVPVVWLDPVDGGYRSVARPWQFACLGGVTPITVWALVSLASLAAVFLIVGLGGRLAALLGLQSFLALTSLDGQGFDDMILSNALWLLVLSRCTATLALDCRLRTGQWVSGERVPAWPRYLVIFQVVLFYWTSGLHKISVYWTPADGFSALYYILQRPGWVRWDMSWLAWIYPLTQAATGVTWIWEVTAPLLLLALWYRRTADRPGRLRALCNRLPLRGLFVLIGVAVHLGILVFMALGPFSWIVWTCYLCLYRPEEWQRYLRLPAAPDSDAPARRQSSIGPHLCGALVALHVTAVTLSALPGPGDSNRDAWQNPKVQVELAAWSERLTAWGWDLSPAELEEKLWALSDGYLRLRNRLTAPFEPYYRYCGTRQGWRMFVAPDTEPGRLEIDVQENGQWRTVYRELDPNCRWLERRLDHARFRAALFTIVWYESRADYYSFAEWVAVQARRDFPHAKQVRVRLYQYRILPADQARARRRPEGKYVQEVELPLAP